MATVAAAVLIRREKKIVEAFRQAGATTPDKAITMESIGMHHRLAFRKLRNRSVLRETAPNYYYLDEERWAVLSKFRHTMAVVSLIAVVAALIWALYMSGHKLPQ